MTKTYIWAQATEEGVDINTAPTLAMIIEDVLGFRLSNDLVKNDLTIVESRDFFRISYDCTDEERISYEIKKDVIEVAEFLEFFSDSIDLTDKFNIKELVNESEENCLLEEDILS